jgi:hypothetical protein
MKSRINIKRYSTNFAFEHLVQTQNAKFNQNAISTAVSRTKHAHEQTRRQHYIFTVCPSYKNTCEFQNKVAFFKVGDKFTIFSLIKGSFPLN